jgi:uncharacterized protein (DUF2267 family)
MDHDRFIRIVARAAGIRQREAKRATRATLETLAEQLEERARRDLAHKLPNELEPWIVTAAAYEPYGADEFVRRVADRAGVDPPSAERDIRAVFAALAQAVGFDALTEIVADLPPDYETFLPPGRSDEVAAYGRFIHRVVERGALRDEESAKRAVDAVLETLGERIAHGEVEDLLRRLPPELHSPLKRGDHRTRGKAEQMTLMEFIERVVDREGVTDEQAQDHIRAVFVTLREAVGDDEFFDVVVELPEEYVSAVA